MDKVDGFQLVLLFTFITFFSSWSYHMCRADLSIRAGHDMCEASHASSGIADCATCPDNTMTWIHKLPGGSDNPISFELSRFIDHLLATFGLLMVFIHVVPISEKIRKLIMVISLIWMVLFLSGGNDAIAVLPAFISFILVMVFWFKTSKHNTEKGFYTRNKAWGLSVVSCVLAVVFFKFDTEPYWLKHSLWHILGAVSGALLLTKTAMCYQDVNVKHMDLPAAFLSVFTNPKECEVLDQ
jgi:hypothetical protein